MNIATLHYSDTETFHQQARIIYNAHRIILIQGFPLGNRERLLAIMSLFGTPQKEHYGPDHDYFHVLKALPVPMHDHKGHVITSSTHSVFDMHTDNYNKAAYALTIGLLCIIPAQNGGESHVVKLNNLLEKLDTETIASMMSAIWPHPTGFIPLLEETQNGLLIRYNRDAIEAFAKVKGTSLSSAQVMGLDRIDAAADTVKYTFKLKTSEMLVMDNTRFLHGRSPFEENSSREFIRWRIVEDVSTT